MLSLDEHLNSFITSGRGVVLDCINIWYLFSALTLSIGPMDTY